jgi:hypothetical protein
MSTNFYHALARSPLLLTLYLLYSYIVPCHNLERTSLPLLCYGCFDLVGVQGSTGHLHRMADQHCELGPAGARENVRIVTVCT